jgi:hypothetical protein
MEKIRAEQQSTSMQFIQTFSLNSQEYLPGARMKTNGERNMLAAQVQLIRQNGFVRLSTPKSLKCWICGSQRQWLREFFSQAWFSANNGQSLPTWLVCQRMND